MYLHPSDHIYLCFFNKDLILLDLKEDRYHLFTGNDAELMKSYLSEKIDTSERKLASFMENTCGLSENSSFLNQLINADILKIKKYPYPYFIDKKNTAGASNVNWRLPLTATHSSSKLYLVECILCLLKVHLIVKLRGFYGLINFIKKIHKKCTYLTPPKDQDIDMLVSSLNRACAFYPVRTKCLEWAVTLVILALKRGWACNLVVGVQNYPFLAHAWVEVEDRVIADSKDLSKHMAIILKEPFRRKN